MWQQPYGGYGQQPPYGGGPQQGGYGAPQGGYGPPQPSQGYSSYAPQYDAPPGGHHHPIGGNYNGPPPMQYGQFNGPPPPPQPGYGPGPGPPQGYGGYGGYGGPPADFPFYLGTPVGWPLDRLPPFLPGYDPSQDLQALLNATQGMGTRESVVTDIFSHRSAIQLAVLGHAYRARKGKTLDEMLHSELSGHYRAGILGLALGPVLFDAQLVRDACKGAGTDETVLTEVLLGRSPEEMGMLKDAFRHKFHRSIEDVVRSDLSAKTARMFVIAFEMRTEPWGPQDVNAVERDARALHDAMRSGRTDELAVCAIVLNRTQPFLRALCEAFKRHGKGQTLTKAIKKHFQGHMEKALLFVVEGGKRDGCGAWRDAKRLEAAMKGMGTNDDALVRRLVRMHASPQHAMAVKSAYRAKYGKDLARRVAGETSGDYKSLMVALVG